MTVSEIIAATTLKNLGLFCFWSYCYLSLNSNSILSFAFPSKLKNRDDCDWNRNKDTIRKYIESLGIEVIEILLSILQELVVSVFILSWVGHEICILHLLFFPSSTLKPWRHLSWLLEWMMAFIIPLGLSWTVFCMHLLWFCLFNSCCSHFIFN